MRPAARLLPALCLTLAACAPGALFQRAPTCLTGPVPHVGRPVPDEMFALMRRERDRAERAPPLVRARILESIPALFPDVSDLIPAPQCEDEIEREGIAALAAQPLDFTRELVARVRAVHDAPALMALAARDEATITEYRLGPDEPGPPPPKSFLRLLALSSIPAYWVADNVAEGRRLMLNRLRASRDARELLLLHGAAEAIFAQALWGHPARAQGAEAPALLRAWIPDLRRRLHEPPDRATHAGRATLELVMVRLADTGSFGVRFGVEREARALVEEILAAGGELPLTRGVPGAARDLAETARGARFDLDTPQKSVRASELPPPRRARFDPRADWLHLEPAGGRVPEAAARARIADLDQELATLRFNAPRCHVIREIGRWLPEREAGQRFDSLLAPVLDGDRLRLDTEAFCRMRVALELLGVEEPRRVALVLRLLAAPSLKPGDRDHRLDEHHPAIAYLAYDDPVRRTAARALAAHPGWIDRNADVRAWLLQRALDPIPIDAASAETWTVLAPAFERAVDLLLSSGSSEDAEAARAVLRAWMGSIREAGSKQVSHIYTGEVIRARLRALGELGRRAGLAGEIGAFLEARGPERAAVIAGYLLRL